MRIPLYHIDAFTGSVFAGNPAAVCPLESWPDDSLLQSIAAENNLSETAFYVPEGEIFRIRWFSPAAEVDLCGHATLATAYVLFHLRGFTGERVVFQSRSGELAVERDGDRLRLDFPAQPPEPCHAPEALIAALGHAPSEVLRSQDYLVAYPDEATVRNLDPDMEKLRGVDLRGVIVTAPGTGGTDFVSRFFVPKLGIPEDPVTGSAHCALVPYWSRRLGKTTFQARQVSARGGDLFCENRGERVSIAGRAVKYMEGTIEV